MTNELEALRKELKELKDMESMYHGQCRITDELADKLEKEKELKGDVRIAELEALLKKANDKIIELNTPKPTPWTPSMDSLPIPNRLIWLTDLEIIHLAKLCDDGDSYLITESYGNEEWSAHDKNYWTYVFAPNKPVRKIKS